MEAKAIKSVDLIAPACRTISQDHLLIDRSPGGAIPIVYDDRDGRRRGRSQRPRRRTSRCLARRLLRREISPRYRTLSTGGDQGPILGGHYFSSTISFILFISFSERFRDSNDNRSLDAIINFTITNNNTIIQHFKHFNPSIPRPGLMP